MEHGKLTRTNIAACNDGGILMERKQHWMTTDDSLMTPHEIVIQCVNPGSKIISVRKGWQRDIHNCYQQLILLKGITQEGTCLNMNQNTDIPQTRICDKPFWASCLAKKTQHNAHRNLVAAYVYTSSIYPYAPCMEYLPTFTPKIAQM